MRRGVLVIWSAVALLLAASASWSAENGNTQPALTVLPEQVSFGEVQLGNEKVAQVELTNGGGGTLDLRSFGVDGSSFFRLGENTCRDQLEPGKRCTLELLFSPLAANPDGEEGELVILSGDLLRPEVRIPLSGQVGIVTPPPAVPQEPAAVPGSAGGIIKVLDAVSPVDDLALPFGNVPLGLAKRKVIAIKNEGLGDLQMGVIPAVSLDEQFTIVGPAENPQHCSERLLHPDENCLILIHFRPAAEVDYQNTLTLPSDDPQNAQIAVTLTGAGTPSTNDYPAPQLIHPEPGQSYLKETVNFRWYTCRDAEGNPATYRLYCSRNRDFTGTTPRQVDDPNLELAGAGLGLFLLFALRRRKGAWVVLLLTAGWLLLSCSDDVEDSTTASVGDLEAEQTYYWKVDAEYKDGLEAESEIRMFTTR